MIFKGRNQVPFGYSRWGYTRGGGKTWHGGIDIVGMDDTTVRMPAYKGKSISGKVVTATIITNHSNLTWEWGWYVCVQLDANQTPDAVNYLYFCHNKKLLVKVGQKVKTGDALAIMGNTGNAAYANPPIEHVHFEVRATRSGRGLDPTAYAEISNAVGIYEIVAGHRRKYACEQAGLDTMPVLIRNLDRDAATIIMVDSNLQRENILPSERAKAYKMKLEAIKRQGARNDLTSPKISAKLRSDDEIGQQMGVSGDTVRNYISLTNLVPELMQMVDEKKIALSPAYQIAALKPEEQQMLVTTIDYEQATPSLSQAQRMKKFSQAGRLNEDSMLAIMSEEKKPEKFSLTFDGERIRKYFPKSYTPLQMENTIIKLLEAWQKKRQRSQER